MTEIDLLFGTHLSTVEQIAVLLSLSAILVAAVSNNMNSVGNELPQ